MGKRTKNRSRSQLPSPTTEKDLISNRVASDTVDITSTVDTADITTITTTAYTDRPLPSIPSTSEHDNARLQQELNAMRQTVAALQTELEGERIQRIELQTAKSLLSVEIEDLTKVLFEEANGMVASEARARWQVEQTQKRLEEELVKTRDLLHLEAEQTRFLRELLEHERNRTSVSVAWDSSVFGARLQESYYDDFFPQRSFNSREHASRSWDTVSQMAADSPIFRHFSSLVDECFKVGNRCGARLDEDAIVAILGHGFMRVCLVADVEPCLAFPVLERTGRGKSLLKRVLPAMLRNNCMIEALPLQSIPSPESIRGSPLSIRSFISITAAPVSKDSSPVKHKHRATGSLNDPSVFAIPSLSPAIGIPQTRDRPSSFTSTDSPFDMTPLAASLSSSPTASVVSVESCPAAPTATHVKCALCAADNQAPTHRFRIHTPTGLDTSPSKSLAWTLICRGCRERLVAVASLFTILRHLLQGLHTHRPKIDIFYDVTQARRYMFYARSGLPLSFFALNDFEAFAQKIVDHGGYKPQE